MKKTNLLILGNSNFVQKRLLKSINTIKNINYKICSKSKKGKDIFFNDYRVGLKTKPDLVYISLCNHMHFKYAKMALLSGSHVIVDKPISLNLKNTLELVKIAKRKKLLISESTLFNYHGIFQTINELLGGAKNLNLIQTNFNIPQIKTLKQISLTKSDCFQDMSPYAASIIRLYLKPKVTCLNSYKEKYLNTSHVKSFYIFAKSKKTNYFGNFSVGNEYLSQIIFSSNKKVIYLNHQAFALPSDKKIKITIKEDNKYKDILINKDDCIKNYLNEIISSIANKNFNKFYNLVVTDAKIRNIINKNNK